MSASRIDSVDVLPAVVDPGQTADQPPQPSTSEDEQNNTNIIRTHTDDEDGEEEVEEVPEVQPSSPVGVPALRLGGLGASTTAIKGDEEPKEGDQEGVTAAATDAEVTAQDTDDTSKLSIGTASNQQPTSPRFRAKLSPQSRMFGNTLDTIALSITSSPRIGVDTSTASSPPARNPPSTHASSSHTTTSAFHVNALAAEGEEVLGGDATSTAFSPSPNARPNPSTSTATTRRVMGSRAGSSLSRAMFTPADSIMMSQAADTILREVSTQMQYEEEVAQILYRAAAIHERKERSKLEKKMSRDRDKSASLPASHPHPTIVGGSSSAATLKVDEETIHTTHSNSGLTTPRAESKKSSTSSAVSTPRGSNSSMAMHMDKELSVGPAVVGSSGVLGGDMMSLQSSTVGPRPHRSTMPPNNNNNHTDPQNASMTSVNNSSMGSKSSRFLSFFSRDKKGVLDGGNNNSSSGGGAVQQQSAAAATNTAIMSPPHSTIPPSETGSFASTNRDSFFGSPVGNNSAHFGSTVNTSNAASTHQQQSPATSSRFLGLGGGGPKAPSASSPAIHATPPESLLRSKVILLGASGSGKTTFKTCFTSSVMKSLPEVRPSLTSSSSKYYHQPTSGGSYRKKLSVTVVDGGPSPLEYGLSNVLDTDSLYVLTMSLEGVKQKSAPKKLFTRSGPVETIIHRGDKSIIRNTLRAIAAVAKRNVAFVLIGTKVDLLTDPSPNAVLSVISALSTVVMSELASIANCSIMYRGCFAVSAVDHKVHSEMREAGPSHIGDLWSMLCETMIKDAVSNIGGTKLISPSSFGWSQDAITSAVNTVSEAVEKHQQQSTSLPQGMDPLEVEALTAPVEKSSIDSATTNPLAFNPKLGNLGTSVMAKFITELTMGPNGTSKGLGTTTIGSLAAALVSGTTNLSHYAHTHAKAIQAPPTILISAGVFTVLDLKRSFLFKDVQEYIELGQGKENDVDSDIDELLQQSTSTTSQVAGDGNAAAVGGGGNAPTSVTFGEATSVCPPNTTPKKVLLDQIFSVRVMSSSLVTGTEDSACPTPSEIRAHQRTRDHYAPTKILTSSEERIQLELLKATNRAFEFIARARTQLNFICVPKRALEHHLYSLGVASRSHFNLILKTLVRNDEIAVYDHQPVGREDTILFQPHVVSRATVALQRTVHLSCYPLPQRRGLLPKVDPEEVDRADPRQLLSGRGLLNDKLLVALSGSVFYLKKDLSERADLYLYLLVTSDFVAVCRGEDDEFASQRYNNDNNTFTAASEPSLEQQLGTPTTKDNSGDTDNNTTMMPRTKSRSKSFFGINKPSSDEEATNCGFYGFGWRFVVPSLVLSPLPQTLLQGVGSLVWLSSQATSNAATPPISNTSLQSAQATMNNRSGGAEAAELHLRLHPCPAFVPHQIICRLAAYIASPNCVRSNGVWLSDHSLGARCLLVFTPYDNNEAIAAAMEEQSRAAASSTAPKGPRQTRSASRTRLKPHCGVEGHGVSIDIYAITSVGGRLAVTAFLSEILTHVRQSLASRAPGVSIRTVKGRPPILNAASTADQEIISHWEEMCCTPQPFGGLGETGKGPLVAFAELDELASTIAP